MKGPLFVVVVAATLALSSAGNKTQSTHTYELKKPFDGINIDLLDDTELEGLVNAEDKKLEGFLDEHIAAVALKQREILRKISQPKRWIQFAVPAGRIAFMAGRRFFQRYAARGITRSGTRVTKHYSRPGNYFTGLKEFKRLNPSDIKRIGGSKFKGYTGKAGNHQITIRSGSKGTNGVNGPPTLSISSHSGKMIRKFRYTPKN